MFVYISLFLFSMGLFTLDKQYIMDGKMKGKCSMIRFQNYILDALFVSYTYLSFWSGDNKHLGSLCMRLF